MPTADTILQLLGRAHPMVLHLPIGLLVGLVALELWNAWQNRRSDDDRLAGTRAPIAIVLWLSVFAALGASASGLILAEEGTHAGSGVVVHRTLALVFTGVLCVAACCHAFGLRTAYRRFLALGLLSIVPAGHFGASLTHGERFLYAPLLAAETEPERPAIITTGVETTFATSIAPVLEARCVSCHGPDRRKGGLRLDSPEMIERGGHSGAVVLAGDAGASQLLARMRLPLEDDEHMPPATKPQPTGAEIALIESWIRAGAPFEGGFAAEPGDGGTLVAMVDETEAIAGDDPALPDAPFADQAALDRLAESFVHVAPVQPGKANLWVDLAPVAPSIDDDRFDTLIAPIAPSLGELHAARTRIGDEAVGALTGAKALTTLDLSWTGFTAEGLSSIAPLPALRELRLVGTPIGDDALNALAAMPALRKLYLWRSGVTAEGVAGLRSARPDLEIITDADPTPALETEGELAFSGDRPLPGGTEASPTAAPSAVSLAPINSACPVSGAPVDPAHAIVFKGRVVGFCCTKCLTAFVNDPDAYAGGIEAN